MTDTEAAPPKSEEGEKTEEGKKLGYVQTGLQIIIFDQPILACLHVFLPVAIVAMATVKKGDSHGEAWQFLFCLLAVVPLAERLGYATEQLTSHVGEVVAGLLNASFGNVPELVVTIVAIAHGLEDVAVQTLVGGVLSALLVVSGLSALFGGASSSRIPPCPPACTHA